MESFSAAWSLTAEGFGKSGLRPVVRHGVTSSAQSALLCLTPRPRGRGPSLHRRYAASATTTPSDARPGHLLVMLSSHPGHDPQPAGLSGSSFLSWSAPPTLPRRAQDGHYDLWPDRLALIPPSPVLASPDPNGWPLRLSVSRPEPGSLLLRPGPSRRTGASTLDYPITSPACRYMCHWHFTW